LESASNNRLSQVIPQRLKFIDPVRLCTKCQQRSLWENDFFDKYLKKLKAGVELYIENSGGERLGARINLSNDCSLLQINSTTGPVPPVFLDEVSSFRILEEGGDGVHSLSVECIDGRSVLFCKGESDSIMFLNGLRRALRMTAKPDHQPGPARNDG